MIVVVAAGETGVEDGWSCGGDGKFLQLAITIEEEVRAVVRPVGSLKFLPAGNIDDVADGGINVNRLKSAVEGRLSCWGGERFQVNV